VFSNFLECWTMDKVQKLSNSECYTLSSEPFRIYLFNDVISPEEVIQRHERREVHNEWRSEDISVVLWKRELSKILVKLREAHRIILLVKRID
jgi:hypothetical protein